MDKQEIFNTVARHLMAQNERAKNPEEAGVAGCRYRLLKDGKMLKCAIGCLISDEHYIEEIIEGLRAGEPRVIDALMGSGYPGEEFGPFYLDLQQVHDDYLPENWPQALKEVADYWKLTCPPEVLERLPSSLEEETGHG